MERESIKLAVKYNSFQTKCAALVEKEDITLQNSCSPSVTSKESTKRSSSLTSARASWRGEGERGGVDKW